METWGALAVGPDSISTCALPLRIGCVRVHHGPILPELLVRRQRQQLVRVQMGPSSACSSRRLPFRHKVLVEDEFFGELLPEGDVAAVVGAIVVLVTQEHVDFGDRKQKGVDTTRPAGRIPSLFKADWVHSL